MANAAMSYKTLEEAQRTQEAKGKIVDRELQRLSMKLGHVPTADEVLESARSTKSALHKFFTWDDREAAEAYRRDEAARMLQVSRFIVELRQHGEVTRVSVRKFVSINRGQPMRLRNEALDEPDARQALIAHAMTDLRSWILKYVDISELEPLRRAIQKLLP
jgi:hypothetical protein